MTRVEKLRTKREYDIYIQTLKDIKYKMNLELKNEIKFFTDSKKFCDKE